MKAETSEQVDEEMPEQTNPEEPRHEEETKVEEGKAELKNEEPEHHDDMASIDDVIGTVIGASMAAVGTSDWNIILLLLS